MRIVLLFALAAVLAGCASKPIAEMSYSEIKDLAVVINQRCLDQGVKPGTPQWDICTKQEISRENATRNRRAAVAASSGPTVCTQVGYTTICN